MYIYIYQSQNIIYNYKYINILMLPSRSTLNFLDLLGSPCGAATKRSRRPAVIVQRVRRRFGGVDLAAWLFGEPPRQQTNRIS